MKTFQDILFTARQLADEPALATIDGVVTYRALMIAVSAALEVIDALPPSDGIVLLDVRNQFHHIVLMIALGLAGRTSASMQTQVVLEQTGVVPSLVLSDTGTVVGALRIEPAWFAREAEPDYAALLARRGFAAPSDLVRVGFSSGVTGFPKAVGMTLHSMERRVDSFARFQYTMPGSDRAAAMVGPAVLSFFPALLAIFARGGMVALANNPRDILHLVRVFRIGLLALAVPQLAAVIEIARTQAPLTCVRSVLAFGSRMSPRLHAEARAVLAPNIGISYGSTEAGLMAWGTGAGIDVGTGSAGYRVPDVEIEIVDRTHRALPVGESGLIRVRGPEMAHYLSATEDTTELFLDGWFYPGDVGRLDPSGLVFIEGRSTELISIGQNIVAPEYIEEVMLTIAGIRDVGVFTTVDAVGHDVIWAAIVTDGSLDQPSLQAALQDALAFRAPNRLVEVRSIPRTEMGKVARTALRTAVLADLR